MYKINGRQVDLEYREYQFQPDFPLFALQEGEFVFPKPFTELRRMHFHNCVEIGICRRGRQILYVEDQVMEFGPGDICVIPPYAMHITQAENADSKEVSCEYLYFQPETMLGGRRMGNYAQPFLWYKSMEGSYIFSGKETGLDQILEGILREMRRKDCYTRYAVYGYLQMLSVKLERSIVGEGGSLGSFRYYERERIFPAISHINENFAEPISEKELANVCGMNPGQFHDQFHLLMGQSPAAYLRFVRLQHACGLLSSTEKRIIDVAMESGFYSLSGFNRSFLETYGKTPRQWRNEKRVIPKKGVSHTTYRHPADETHRREEGRHGSASVSPL